MTEYSNRENEAEKGIAIRSYEIPIRIRALKTANIYILETEGKKILVDSGMGPEVDNFLKFSGEDLRSIDLIILTHMHIDHVGGASHLRSKYGIPVAMGRNDVSVMDRIRTDPGAFRSDYFAQLKESGMPESILNGSASGSPAIREVDYYGSMEVDYSIDDKFGIGSGQSVKLIHVPGHSPGSTCIHVPGEKAIFTGDHILGSITPNISKYMGIYDSLGSYMESLKKLQGLDVTRVLPGHGAHMTSLDDRISHILEHHRRRLEEIEGITTQWYSPYEVARRMKWSRGRDMDSMNGMEKIFAVGEATSHLERLEADGKVRGRDQGGIRQFRSAGE